MVVSGKEKKLLRYEFAVCISVAFFFRNEGRRYRDLQSAYLYMHSGRHL